MITRIYISPSLNFRQEEFLKVLNEIGSKPDHPDVLYINNEEKLGVEASKRVREFLSVKPYSAKGKTVLVESAQNFTPEAQNSLLKILEEPPIEANIGLGVEKESQLLPTIVSRCRVEILEGSNGSKGTEGSDVENLQRMSIEERFEFVEKLEDKKGFLDILANYFRGEKLEKKENLEFAKEIITAIEWAGRNGNIRAILEYLMLTLPEKPD